ncbi:hypothetical protein SADUNF_Sadunf05G0049700 [Salix dunnii]|uniref:C2 domain-containing protein n=1 Tax=Salix dunnii TaxID=1413687 RepID=A0A835K9K8_9ROSI|nr:hypothetical protein SADUNF_Sadunf05G0049700 [Salix dunnii]
MGAATEGKNKRIQLNSREISSKSNLVWNESFSLECLGTDDSINNLKQETVVFELRWRNINPILAKIGGSQLLGRAEVPWQTVLESPNLEMEKWVMLVPKKGSVPDDVKPPSVQIAMKARVPEMAEMAKKNRRNGRLKGRGCCKDSGYVCKRLLYSVRTPKRCNAYVWLMGVSLLYNLLTWFLNHDDMDKNTALLHSGDLTHSILMTLVPMEDMELAVHLMRM